MSGLLLPIAAIVAAIVVFALAVGTGRDGGEAFWMACGAFAFTVVAIAFAALAFA